MRTILASIVVLLSLQQGALAQQPQEPAGASAYLVGAFDTRQGLTTLVQIVNPTREDLRLFIAFFDDEEELLACIPHRLTGNDLFEIDAQQVVQGRTGVVKVVTLAMNEARPQIGVVGNQRLVLERQPVAETGLHPIQMAFVDAELEALRGQCGF